MKILILCTAVIAALAEPPVINRYLPPNQGLNVLSAPSQNYGPPNSEFGGQKQTDAVFGRAPSSSYNAPSFNSQPNRPSSQYGAPSLSQGPLQTPSSQYGAPSQNQAPSSQYGAPALSSQYGAPQNQGSYQAPSSQYGTPGFGQQQARPSQQYGAPGIGGQGAGNQYSQNGGYNNGAPNGGYLPPGSGRGEYDDGSNGEPANYSFEYMVKDDQSGNDFGHREARQGNRAEGLYYVLLPDGRKQTVQYEADENGYKPRISYEDTGRRFGGYDRNSQGLGGGYNQGGY